MLEIDIDVGRLIALAAHETLEEHVDALGIDRRHAECEADRAIGRGAATLAKNAARARESDDLVNSEKVRRIAEIGNDGELMLELPRDLLGHAARIAFARALPCDLLEMRHRGPPLLPPIERHDLVGILVAQLGQRELRCAVDEAPRGVERLGAIAVTTKDLLGPPQPPLSVGGDQPPRPLNRHAGTDASDGIEQLPARRMVHADIARCGDRQSERSSKRVCALRIDNTFRLINAPHGNGHAIGHDPRQPLSRLEKRLRRNPRRNQHGKQALSPRMVAQHRHKIMHKPRTRTTLDTSAIGQPMTQQTAKRAPRVAVTGVKRELDLRWCMRRIMRRIMRRVMPLHDVQADARALR